MENYSGSLNGREGARDKRAPARTGNGAARMFMPYPIIAMTRFHKWDEPDEIIRSRIRRC
jgi:hypothetical protein